MSGRSPRSDPRRIKAAMQAKRYKPTPFVMAVMAGGLAVIVAFKLSRNGLVIWDWKDVVFYCVAPIALGLVANLFFASIRVDDEHIEIVGMFSRRKYPLADITAVKTEKGADPKFQLKDERWISLPSWADGWSVAAALRYRLKQLPNSGEVK